MKTAVVLISYNQENFILDALEGIRIQSVKPDEVVIADDCSKDNTQNIILEFVEKHGLHDWKLSFNDNNLGINGNLQKGIDQTTAEIIMVMSGDDISLSNRCEVAILLFKAHPSLHVVTTSINKIDESKNYIGELVYQDELVDNVKKVIIAGMPNVFPVGQNWRRSVIEKFGKLPNSVPNEDDQITFRAILDGGIFCSSIKTVDYRIHSNSASSWLRNNQTDEEYFARFLSDMTVRRTHMELWKATLLKVNRDDRAELEHLIDLKIGIYKFLKNLTDYNLWQRIKFLHKCNKALGLREKYYIALGKYGVLSWRKAKRMTGR